MNNRMTHATAATADYTDDQMQLSISLEEYAALTQELHDLKISVYRLTGQLQRLRVERNALPQA